jgi:hypothetical protein
MVLCCLSQHATRLFMYFFFTAKPGGFVAFSLLPLLTLATSLFACFLLAWHTCATQYFQQVVALSG